jgi:hypothetical protein
MTKATEYVDYMYSLFEGRAAVTVGVNSDCEVIHPLVFENNNKMPIGLIALSAASLSNPADVDVYHISAFTPGKGQGSEILNSLCRFADDFGVRLCIQAEAQHSGNQILENGDLIDWYHKFGFTGNRIMHREPCVNQC